MKHLPNIIILMPDQYRADCTGTSGNKFIKTPNIDKIAENGIFFENCFTVSPLCMPARASFISGLYSHNHRIWSNEGNLPPDDETFFHHLKETGYFTAYIGKSHFYPHGKFHMKEKEPYMHARGIDYVHETTGPWATVTTDSYMTDYLKEKGLLSVFREDYVERKKNRFATHPSPLPEEDYLDSYVGKQAVKFLKEYNNDKPLCLFVGFPGPHEPWDPPKKYAEMYDSEKVQEPISAGNIPPWFPEKVRERLKKERERFSHLDEEKLKKVKRNYYGKITLIDYWIGKIIDVLYEKNWFDNSLIIFWSDHGEMLGDHGLFFKQVFYESSVKVPLIIKMPENMNKGKRIKSLVEIIDVFPTILDISNSFPSERCLGKTLLPLIEDRVNSHRESVLSEIYFMDLFNYMLRTENYKYAVYGNGEGFLLFDLKNDPYEKINLIGNPDFRKIEDDLKEKVLEKILSLQLKM